MDKRVLVVVGGFVAFAIITLGIWLTSQLFIVRTGIQFIVVPDNISVAEGERRIGVSYESIINFEPGRHILEFSRDGFSSEIKDITVVENEVAQVYVLLNPKTDEAKKIINEPKMTSRIERISGYIITEGSKQIESEYPFVNSLPIIDKFFSIKSCVNEDGKIEICVKLIVNNKYQKNRAISAIKNVGVDTLKYKVNFVSSQDPH